MSEVKNLSNGIQLSNTVNIGYARRKQILVDMIASLADAEADQPDSITFNETLILPEFPTDTERITLLQLITHGKEAACRGEFHLPEERVIPFALFVDFKSAGKDEIVGLHYFT